MLVFACYFMKLLYKIERRCVSELAVYYNYNCLAIMLTTGQLYMGFFEYKTPSVL